MTIAQIVTLLAAIGGPAGLVAIIMVLPQIKKLQADTSKVEKDAENADIDGASILSAAALAQMAAAVARADAADTRASRLEAIVETLRARIEQLEQHDRDYRDAAAEHVAWDVQRIAQLEELGITSPPAPALLRPREEWRGR